MTEPTEAMIDELDQAILQVDCTGDEMLWVFRYARYIKPLAGCTLAEAIAYANEAWKSWGHDPDCTPEEIASADFAEFKP